MEGVIGSGGLLFESWKPRWSSCWLLARDGTWCELGPLCPWISARLLSTGRRCERTDGPAMGGGAGPFRSLPGRGWCRGGQVTRPSKTARSWELASAGGGGLLESTSQEIQGTWSRGSLQLGFRSQPSAHFLCDPGQVTCPLCALLSSCGDSGDRPLQRGT